LPQLSDREDVDKPGMEVVHSDDRALAFMRGRIDIESSPAVRAQLIVLLRTPHLRTVSIDLSRVSHIDSSGVATLIEGLKIARNSETQLVLQGLHDRLNRLFEATGILSLFDEGIQR
jgi:anti-sigma B factor antagonist